MPLQLRILSSIVKKSSGISFLFDRPLKRHKGSNTDFGWKIAKRSALPSEVTRQRRQGRRLTLTCLPIKNWHTLLKSRSNSGQNPNSAECVRIASNAAAPDARENIWSRPQSDGWCNAGFHCKSDHLWCGFWLVRWWWIAFPPHQFCRSTAEKPFQECDVLCKLLEEKAYLSA